MKFVFDNLDNSTDPLRIAVYFQNVGREPARDVRDWTSYAFVRTPLSPSELRENTYFMKDDTFKAKHICANVTSDIVLRGAWYPQTTADVITSVDIGPENELDILPGVILTR